MGIPAIPGVIIGGFLSTDAPLNSFKILFAVLLILVGIYLIFKNRIIIQSNFKSTKNRFYPLFILGTFSAGIIAGFFGVGGGIIFVPILVIVFQKKMINALPTSQFAILLTSSTGVIIHIILENHEYIVGISLALGSFLGAQIGSKYLNKINEDSLRYIFSIFLGVVAFSLLISL